MDRLLAQLEGRHGIGRPILVHAILETSLGVTSVEEIATASPRMQGLSFGPADLAASRRMKTTRPGGPHPDYRVLEVPGPAVAGAPRGRPIRTPGILDRADGRRLRGGRDPAFYGPYGDIGDPEACEAQFRSAFIIGCAGAWSLHPSQIDIAKRVFSPAPPRSPSRGRSSRRSPTAPARTCSTARCRTTRRGSSARCSLLAPRMLAHRPDPELAERYGLDSARV